MNSVFGEHWLALWVGYTFLLKKSMLYNENCVTLAHYCSTDAQMNAYKSIFLVFLFCMGHSSDKMKLSCVKNSFFRLRSLRLFSSSRQLRVPLSRGTDAPIYKDIKSRNGGHVLAPETSNSCNEAESIQYNVHVFDKYGMPVTELRDTSNKLSDLVSLSPSSLLQKQLEEFLTERKWKSLTPIQSTVIPLALEHYDVLCVSPTATGKTFGYAFPSIARVIMKDVVNGSHSGPSINGSDVEELIRQKINRGEICKYCELDTSQHKLCPITGTLHPEVISDESTVETSQDLNSFPKPSILCLVPTTTLVHQVYKTFLSIREKMNVRYLVRSSSAEEQKRYLRALENADILISTPETLLPALIKGKLSFSRVSVLIMDEIDELLSHNHFEPVKIILSALPKGTRRPQRLLFGASLPPAVYQMIREKILKSTHRFVLADSNKIHSASSPSQGNMLTSNNSISHIVMTVSQTEKIQKLMWLYQTEKILFDQRTIIFCNTRHNVAFVADRLKALMPQLHVTTLSSKASDTAKLSTLKMFYSGVSTCLVSTDIISRGMDFRNVVYVVQYDLPIEMSTWVHRSGRCGRNGRHGFVYSFFQPENIKLAKPLVAYLRDHRQLVPPKLQEYSRQSFVDLFKSFPLYHPTRAYRRSDPQNYTPVLGRGTPRFPDYKQESIHKHQRPH